MANSSLRFLVARLDLKTYKWSLLHPNDKNRPPSPRSGHRMFSWRGYIVLFGGFFEQAHDIRFFNDLWVYEFSSNAWTQHAYGKLAQVPQPRSAFGFACEGDAAVLSGGFAKVKNPTPGSKVREGEDRGVWSE